MQRRRWLIILLCVVALFAALLIYANLKDAPLPDGFQADKILVEKSRHQLTLLKNGAAIKTYKIALANPTGNKVQEGDNRTPEGIYTIDRRNDKSGFHLALHVSYPNQFDIVRAQQAGVAPGGDIMIHGLRNGLGWIGKLHRLSDWTRGCMAVTNPEIEEIARAVPNGTAIEILP